MANALATGRAPNPRPSGAENDLLGDVRLGDPLVDPASGTHLGPGLTLYHDAVALNAIVRQRHGELTTTVYQFEGSYLSLAAKISGDAAARLRAGWRLFVDLDADASRRVTVFLRLNMQRRSARVAPLHDILVLGEGPRSARFDLDAEASEAPSDAWLDIILSHPRMSEVRIRGAALRFEAT